MFNLKPESLPERDTAQMSMWLKKWESEQENKWRDDPDNFDSGNDVDQLYAWIDYANEHYDERQPLTLTCWAVVVVVPLLTWAVH